MRAYSRTLLWGMAIVAVLALAVAAPAAADDDLSALLEAQTGVFDSEALALTSAAFDADQDGAMMEVEAETEVEANVEADAASERRRWHRRAAPVHRPAPVRHVHRPAPVRHVHRAVHRPAPVRHVHRAVHRRAPVRHVHRAVHRPAPVRHVHRAVHRPRHVHRAAPVRHVHRARHVVHRAVHRPRKVHHRKVHKVRRRHRRRKHRKVKHAPKKHKVRRAIRKIARKVHRKARKVHRKARKVARKVHRKAKKVHRKARRAVRKAVRKAKKVHRKARRAVRKVARKAVRKVARKVVRAAPKAFDIKVSPHGYRNRYISDWGYAHNRQWVDVRGAGVKNDYGRWVGNHPHIWYSIAVHECPNQYSGRGEFLLVGGKVKRGPNFKGLCPGSKQAAQVPHVKVPPPAPRKSKKAAAKPYKAKHHRRYKHEAFTPAAAPPPKQFPKVKHAPKKSPPRAPPAPPAPKVPKAEPPVLKRKPKTGAPSGKVWKPESKSKGFRAPPLVQKEYPNLLSSKAKEAKQESAQLSCPGGKVIEVRDATYGKGFGVWQASGYISKGQCHAHFARDPAAKACNGKSECTLKADDELFGNPCPKAGKTKELLVVYRCVKEAPKKSAAPAASQLDYPGIKVLLTEANKDAELKCSSGKIITVLDASFGTGQGLYASNGHIKKGPCHARSSALTVMKACHGKSTCKVDADEPVFAPLEGECGPGPAKQLKVTYHCGRKAREFVKPAVPAPRKYEKTDEVAASLKKTDLKAETTQEKEGDGVVRIGGSEVHIHVTQQSMPEPNADALREVETNLDGLHSRALGEIEGLLSDIESHRVAAKPCLKKLKKTIHKFKTAFVQEASKVEKITHKYSYADDAPTLAL